jgi:hypothetical protein
MPLPTAQEFATGKQHKVAEPKIEVKEISFTGNIALLKWPGGAALPTVNWKNAANPDIPVCYEKNSAAMKISALLRYESVALAGSAKISVRAVSAALALEFRKDGVTLNEDADTLIADIPVKSGKLENKVKKASLELDWSVSYDKGKTWSPLGKTGPHKIYQVQAAPLEAALYDFALEKACGYVNGDADALAKINKGIPVDLQYDPGAYRSDANPLGYYRFPSCLCMNNAKLMAYLARSIGIDATVKYIWGGDAADRVVFYWAEMAPIPGEDGNCSFRVLVRQKDFADKDPHFTYHAQTVSGGQTYDPSYGNIGLISLNETAPGSSRQTGPAWPPARYSTVAWRCPH